MSPQDLFKAQVCPVPRSREQALEDRTLVVTGSDVPRSPGTPFQLTLHRSGPRPPHLCMLFCQWTAPANLFRGHSAHPVMTSVWGSPDLATGSVRRGWQLPGMKALLQRAAYSPGLPQGSSRAPTESTAAGLPRPLSLTLLPHCPSRENGWHFNHGQACESAHHRCRWIDDPNS